MDKPAGISSNDVVQQAKRLFGAQKVGHTGSLDPLATGVLPLCFGEATKFSRYLLDANKTYWTRIRIGVSTETGDADGDVVEEVDASAITRTQVSDALDKFVGEIEQIPSMYSALKKDKDALVSYNKIVKKEGENIKVTLRNIRRTANTSISNLEKDKKISKDFERDYTIEIQDLTDKYIKISEEIVLKKIEEISEV